MPYVNFDDPATWASLYNPPFIRANKEQLFGTGMRDARNLRLALEAVGMRPTQTVALIGGGYGWVAEEFIAAGYQKVAVFDTSAYIQGNKAVNAVLTIYNEGGTTSQSRRSIRSTLTGNGNTAVDWAISEDILPCLLDSEISTYAPQLRQIATNVAHWVSPKEDGNVANLNWKTLAEWKAFMAPDWIVGRGAGSVS